MESSNRIEVLGVGKRFGKTGLASETIALDNVSLGIGDGEFVCLLGPSGCGKSTVLNLIAGFDFPSEGQILLDGTGVTEPGIDRVVVFQQPNLFPWLTVSGNVAFGPRMMGRSTADFNSAARRFIEIVGLKGFEDHRPYELSGGMRQRVALARAWINEPEALLMDEPFGALDAQTRLMMQELLLDVWSAAKTTVLFITHDVEEALLLADRILIMSARPGRVKEEVVVPFSRPRDFEKLMLDEHYLTVKQEVFHSVRQETLRAMPTASRSTERKEGNPA